MKAFTEFRSTQHTPYPQHTFPAKPRTYGNVDKKYIEIPLENLFVNRLKGKEGKEREEELKKCLEPDETEKLLFGFKSYSLMGKKGLFNTEWKEKPLVKLNLPSIPWLPLSSKILKKREKEKKDKKKNELKKKEKKKKSDKDKNEINKLKKKRKDEEEEEVNDKDKPIKKRKVI
jgi:hypothetical protein